jgi:hypothetical protein
MGYLLEQRGDNYFSIANDNSDCCVGYASSRQDGSYDIEDDDGNVLTVVKSLADAIPTLAAYLEKNPPRWQRESATRYVKSTEFGVLRVEQERPQEWSAYRGEYPMLRNGNPAIFASREEAQRLVDLHYREGYPNSEIIFDGFAWYPDTDPWWSYPHRVLALRGKVAA